MLKIETDKKGNSAKRAILMMLAVCMTFAGVGGMPAIFSEAAHASTIIEPRTKIVYFHDLNLASSDGREVLDHRIRKAAKYVCSETGIAALSQARKIRQCNHAAYRNAWVNARHRIENRQLAMRVRQ